MRVIILEDADGIVAATPAVPQAYTTGDSVITNDGGAPHTGVAPLPGQRIFAIEVSDDVATQLFKTEDHGSFDRLEIVRSYPEMEVIALTPPPRPASSDETVKPQGSSRLLQEFREKINQQIKALHATSSNFLAQEARTSKDTPREIRIEIKASLDDPESRAQATFRADSSMDCWDHTYACGKSASGYIYCTERVCMIVGPVTATP